MYAIWAIVGHWAPRAGYEIIAIFHRDAGPLPWAWYKACCCLCPDLSLWLCSTYERDFKPYDVCGIGKRSQNDDI